MCSQRLYHWLIVQRFLVCQPKRGGGESTGAADSDEKTSWIIY